jgi:hypothetical protein
VATIAIKGKTSSSKSLFSILSKNKCLMAKEGRKKVKSNTPFSPKYVTSDEDTLSSDNFDSSDDDNPLLSELVKNPNAMIKCLMRQVGARGARRLHFLVLMVDAPRSLALAPPMGPVIDVS